GGQNNTGNFPCVPVTQSCSSPGFLGNYNSIPADRKSVLGNSSITSNESLRRIPDGGTWSGFAASTYGYCNEDCAEPEFTFCGGTATAIATGTGGYSYLWND